ncbi:MAG: hypothetical protein A3K83_00130, partial [Omnitrophica WOR_2 bacterium RBG_13_44_8b]
MPKFFLYARKSIDDEDRQVLSIDAQINELRQFALKEKLEVVSEFTEAMSAKSPGRPIFGSMLKQMECGKATGILAWHPDRLARNSVDGGKIIYLTDIGIITDLHFPTYRFDNTAQGKFMLSIAFGQSKYYIDNLSENVKRGLREKVRRGEWPAWAPTGYLNDYKNKTIVVDPDKAPIIKKLFELYAGGAFSLEELLQYAHQLGFIGKKGKPVRKSELALILRNPFYYGIMRYQGELHQGSHPPLISKKLFDQVQAVLEQKARPKQRKPEKFAFLGLMRCGECGASITAELQKGHVYYRCTKKISPCEQKFLREEALLGQINSAISRVYIDDEAKEIILRRFEESASQAGKASSLQTRLAKEEITKLDEKIEKVIDLYISKEISQAEFQKMKAKLVNQKKDLEERLGE